MSNITDANLKKKKIFEEDISFARINETINEQRKFISGELKREHLNTETGLSVFDRRRIKTESAGKPLSFILNENKRINQK